MPAQFSGIELKNELEIPGSVITVLSEMAEQEAHGDKSNAGYTTTLTN